MSEPARKILAYCSMCSVLQQQEVAAANTIRITHTSNALASTRWTPKHARAAVVAVASSREQCSSSTQVKAAKSLMHGDGYQQVQGTDDAEPAGLHRNADDEISSSLPTQVLLFFNVMFSAVYLVIEGSLVLLKVRQLVLKAARMAHRISGGERSLLPCIALQHS